ncbi:MULTISPECIES: sterol desaturase family protein [Hyphomonadaceae]|jgi:sterol desaturase/sphingolipid hydroxylase (fatty acid hydroxylase superfamily)|uniref:Sterol desaturase family protein n=1 Tax=Henriciella mobilis TaxID=2305467 RepID=A0A399R6S1_9PROT|nr:MULTISPECIES: sterol desaturase family protein [Hyphomonadaceae]MAI91794.1 fatty acid hydroxylase [Ponticaulis sp.]RIJ26463.1 sterol desaturase family protein [Henriciella mobilis]|tara:strand:- start:1732 stop:2610 length:879 start_codon:yes stop_codon:yes gene_type:complete
MGILRFLVRYGYAPLFFIGFIGAAVWMVANGASKIWLAGLLLPAIALSFIAERIAPFEENWNHSKGDTTRDTLHAVINELTNAASIAAIPILAAMTHGFDVWPGEWPLWAQLVMTILIADFGITMAHYASHKIEALWRLHAVHHSVERMYGFNGLMKHPLHQAIELTAGTTPLLLMGMPLEIGALLGFAAAIQLLLQHSNTDMRVGPLIYLWAVAPGHRHHHLAHKVKGDVNFGLFTMLWDHLLGTFVKDRPQPRDGELGVAGRPDYPVGYSAQLVEPFRRWDRSKNTQLAE